MAPDLLDALIALHSVQDGDTLTVACTPRQPIRLRIRLADIDAPERDEGLFHESREQLAELVRGSPLRVEPAAIQRGGWDGYNRLIAYVWVREMLVQEMLVVLGRAVVYCPRGPNQHTQRLEKAQEIARKNELGVWLYPSHRLTDVYHRRKHKPFNRR